jgi:hypothetical protein
MAKAVPFQNTYAAWRKGVRKMGRFRGGISEKHPSGAKAQPLFCCICGATEVVPFQNLCRGSVFPQPVKLCPFKTQK